MGTSNSKESVEWSLICIVVCKEISTNLLMLLQYNFYCQNCYSNFFAFSLSWSAGREEGNTAVTRSRSKVRGGNTAVTRSRSKVRGGKYSCDT